MKYFFIPGRNYELSKAELLSVLKSNLTTPFNFQFLERFIILESKENQEVITRLFNRLGGYISYGAIYEDVDSIISEVVDRKKVVFGVSIHTDNVNRYKKNDIKSLLEQMKTLLKDNGVSSRYIIPKGLLLDTAQVIHNRIVEKGFELVILEEKGFKVYGKTLAVQNINLFASLEYDKPYTNKEMGVLPAKLATIMVNLLGVKDQSTIWDPFCGSGTIALVALLNGYNVIGSDIDPEAVEGTKTNVAWLSNSNKLNNVGVNIFEFDVLNPDNRVIKDLRRTSLQGLVCEPYMGPPQYKPMSTSKAQQLLDGVKELYSSLFDILEHIKLESFNAVIVIPSYKTREGWLTLSLNSVVSKKWKVESNLAERDLHWKRSNSIIKRNIFVLSKKK